MTPERDAADADGTNGDVCRLSTAHLSPSQLSLLTSLLNSYGRPYGLMRGVVEIPLDLRDDALSALAWVTQSSKNDEAFDEDDTRSLRPPLVRPPRAPLHDGRFEATRWRRLSAGLIDEVLVGVPSVLASWAGAAPWTAAVIHAVYYVAPTSLWGWSIGKLWCGIRVADRCMLDTPAWWRSLVRWFVAAMPLLLALGTFTTSDVLGLAVVAINAPIVVSLRGLHDYAAGTVVVEKSAAGPGLWMRPSGTHRVSERR